MKIKANLNLMFSLLQGFYWATMGVFSGFLALYLKQINYQEDKIGLVLSIASLACVIVQPFVGKACDNSKKITPKNLIILSMVLGGVSLLIFPYVSRNFIMAIFIVVIYAITIQAMSPILDAWTMSFVERDESINYGLTRGAGSASYGIVAVFLGGLIATFGVNIMFILAFMFSMVTALIAFMTPFTKNIKENKFSSIKSKEANHLWKNFPFMLFLVVNILMFTAQCSAMSFYPTVIENSGGGSREFGIGIFVMAMSEFIVMFFSKGLLNKFAKRKLLSFSILFLIIKMILFLYSTTVLQVISVQLLQGLSVGLYIPVAVAYVTEIVEENQLVTALSMYSVSTFGIGFIIGGVLGGNLITIGGTNLMFIVNITLVTLALILFLATSRRKSQKVLINKLVAHS